MNEWPCDENGKPLAKVSNGIKETIPTVPYGNVTLGPSYVEKYVVDEPAAIRTGLHDCLLQAEVVLGDERDALLKKIKEAGIR